MDFNRDTQARFAVDKRFYGMGKNTSFLGGTNNYDEAVAFVLGLSTDDNCYYAIYDRQTRQDVFSHSDVGYGGFASAAEITEARP